MKGSLKVRVAVVAVAVTAGAAGFATSPASADTGTATIAGTGNFAAGLGLSGPAQAFNFNGQGVIATTGVQGEILCAIAGFDTIGTLVQGAGNFNGNCNTSAGAAMVAGNFTRAGTFVTLSGAAAGAVNGAFSGPCVFSPLPVVSTSPLSATVGAFAVTCQLAIT